MIRRTFNESIHLNPREIESELWEMDTIEQIDFLLAMIQRFDKEFGNVCMQLENLKDEKNKVLTDLEKRYLKDRLETILEYLG